jgi:polar amino acid transport system substrate-binding protein
MRFPILASLLCIGVAASAGAVDLRLVYTDNDSRPYLTGNGQEIPARPGMAVELVQRCVTRLGGRLILNRTPARRMAEEAKNGRHDGILGFRYSPERARELVFPMRDGRPDTVRYAARLAHSLYRRQGEDITWDGRNIRGLKFPVAVSATLLVSETLLAQGLEIVRVERSGQMFGMLARGRVDAVVTLDIIGDREMAAQTQGYIEKLMPPVLIEDFHVPVSRQFYAANREFMESLWRLIGETREATYAELSPKYLF